MTINIGDRVYLVYDHIYGTPNIIGVYNSREKANKQIYLERPDASDDSLEIFIDEWEVK